MHLLGFYLVILTVIFVVELIITILVVVDEEKVVNWAAEHADPGKSLDIIK